MSDVEVLRAACIELALVDNEIENLESKIAESRRKRRLLCENVIPSMMDGLDLQEMTTRSGLRVSCVSEVFATLPKDPSRRQRALEFVRNSGNAGLIRTKISLSYGVDGDQQASRAHEVLLSSGVLGGAQYSRDQTIHHSSYKKLARTLVESGEEYPEDAGICVRRVAKMETR